MSELPKRIWYEPLQEFAWPYKPENPDNMELGVYVRIPTEEERERAWDKFKYVIQGVPEDEATIGRVGFDVALRELFGDDEAGVWSDSPSGERPASEDGGEHATGNTPFETPGGSQGSGMRGGSALHPGHVADPTPVPPREQSATESRRPCKHCLHSAEYHAKNPEGCRFCRCPGYEAAP